MHTRFVVLSPNVEQRERKTENEIKISLFFSSYSSFFAFIYFSHPVDLRQKRFVWSMSLSSSWSLRRSTRRSLIASCCRRRLLAASRIFSSRLRRWLRPPPPPRRRRYLCFIVRFPLSEPSAGFGHKSIQKSWREPRERERLRRAERGGVKIDKKIKASSLKKSQTAGKHKNW